MPRFRAPILKALACLGLAAAVAPATAQQAAVSNTATLRFEAGGATRTVTSNTVTLLGSARLKRPTTLSFRKIPDNFMYPGLRCETTPTIRVTPAYLSEAELASAEPIISHNLSDALVVVLEAQGSNRDPNLRETAVIIASVGATSLELPLLETGVNSGVFAGAAPAANEFPENNACDLRVSNASGKFVLTFMGDEFSTGSTSSLLIDPTGFVFDSRSGKPVSGATVTIIDEATGAPAAMVFAEDGDAYPNTVVSGASATDSNGDVLKFEPGQFRFPLLPPGNYRLRITPPAGYTAPSVVPRESLTTFVGPRGAYDITDASYGGVFALIDPEPVNIDIPIDSPLASQPLLLRKTTSIREASPGDFVQYRLELTNRGSVAARDVSIVDSLPEGLRFKPDSAHRIPNSVLSTSVSGNGRTLTFAVPTVAPGETVLITYVTEVVPGAPQGQAVNRATAAGATSLPSNEASAAIRIKPLLFSNAMTIIGRVTEGDCRAPERDRKGVGGIRLLLEDGTFVVTDRDGMYHIEGVRPGTHVVQVDVRSIAAAHEPVACDSDTRQGRSAISRFVEGGGGSLLRVDFQLRPTGKKAEAVSALPIVIADDAVAAGNRPDWLAQATPGIDWLFPASDHNPRAPAVRVVIRHRPGQRVALTVNGAVSDPLLFDGSDADEARGVAVSRWSGLPLQDGDNVLVARVLEASGETAETLTRTVHYANAPARVTYAPEQSRLVADGLARPLIAIRVVDRDGRPVRAGTMVPFRVNQPYTAAQEIALEQGRQLAGLEGRQATARVVGDDGIAFVALEPTMQPGAAHINITLRNDGVDQVSEFKAWLSAGAQDWVVVGFGKGTLGFDMLRAGTKSLGLRRRKVVTDGQASFYAKGRIKGSWLMTIAYDSDKQHDRDRGLLGTIDPDRYYTVYGDGTLQGYDAATDRKLYLRLEAKEFYALFGDFETGLTETKLARYSRTINGVKAEYQGRVITFTGFAANDDNLYGRDEIQGNGLSGPYRLSANGIVANSDKISLETRDRFRSEKIVETRQLTRHIDYDIDPDAGTIRFREPILSRDSALNPIFIVADYETYGRSRKLIAGGRAGAKLLGGRVELGASVLHDETVATATVAAVDLKVRVAKNTIARAEGATGGRGGIGKGRAYRAEIEHHGGSVDAVAYTHRQDRDFGLGQQNFGEAGTVKYGVDGRVRLLGRLSLTGSGWYQRDLDGDAKRAAGEARLEYRRDHGTLFASAQFASDRTLDGHSRQSRLLGIGGTQNLLKDKLQLTAQTQFAIGGLDESVDFPVRHVLEAAYRIKPDIRLIASQEIARGDRYTAHSTRVGFDLAPWSGARLLTTLNQQAIGENGPRTFAQYGLNQSVPLGNKWTIDATVDASSTVKGRVPTEDIINPFQPVSSGTSIGGGGRQQLDGDYKSATLGATYRGTLWSWNGRVEYRTSDRSDRWGFNSNLLRTLGAGKTIASSIEAYSIRETNGATTMHASADVAFAFRPIDSRWSVLERFELRHERADRGASASNALGVPVFAAGDQTTSRAINNLAINYRTGDEGSLHGIEASVYYGAKYIRGRYADEVYQGFIDMVGVEVRKDLGPRFDLGVHASMQHSWSGHTKSFSMGPSIGVSPARDSWISLGYNVTGFRDRDFEEARYTRQGPYLTMRLKFDQGSLRRAGDRLGVSR